MTQNDTAEDARELLAQGAGGRTITRVILDYSVTLQRWHLDRPTAELKFEGPFELTDLGGDSCSIEPGQLGAQAEQIAALHQAVVGEITVSAAGALTVTFQDGRTIEAGPQPGHESWSYVSDDGSRIVCMPGGHLAIWSPST